MRTLYYIEGDGGDHLNVYSRGKTELGKWLSNFHECVVNTPDGEFKSIEGYWFWLKCEDDKLRELSGSHAKNYGQYHSISFMRPDDFEKKIKIATLNKILDNDYIREAFLLHDDHIPFVHYYVYDGKIKDMSDNFQIKYLNDLNLTLKQVLQWKEKD